MIEKSIRIRLEYLGSARATLSRDYRILEIVGVPCLEFDRDTTFRVGDMITEDQALALSDRPAIEIKTVMKSAKR